MALIDELQAEMPPLKVWDGGAVRVGQTRVSLDTVLGAFNSGCAPEEIVSKYPTLDLGDVYWVIGFCLRHAEAINEYLSRRRVEAEEIHHKIEARWPRDGVRERLLARRAKQP